MRSYIVKLPRGIEVDIFNLPEDFEKQIKESFRGYTEETAKEYRYCDKLGYIDCCIKHLNGGKRSDNIVSEMVEGRILHEWRENGEIIEEDCYAVHGANSKEEVIEIWNNRVEHLKELDQQKGCKKIFEEMQKNQLR